MAKKDFQPKSTKKTSLKNSNDRTTKPKPKPRPRARLIGMDDVYRLLNRVQLGEKEIKFAVGFGDASTADNVIRDSGLPYEKNELKTRVSFTVRPDPQRNYGDERLEIDFLVDEIPEWNVSNNSDSSW